MHTSLLLTTLLTTALSTQGITPSSPGLWAVTNYNRGCSTSPPGCAYSFNITYTPPSHPSSPIEPTFSTSCNGTDVDQDGYKPCADASVASKTEPGIGNFTLFVQHSWVCEGVAYTETGNKMITELETAGQSFEIVPSVITAVA
jgi:hypothetical protein